jgi:FlaA1/EpsC-like NDP-sugar epimerase
MVLDTVAVIVAYGIAEIAYFRDHPPSLYWRHFAAFAILAVVVHLACNTALGLYGRIWRHAGIEEARQVVLAALTALVVLLGLRVLWQQLQLEFVPIWVVVTGSVFVTMAMGALRFHSRLFAWQRGSRGAGLRVGVIGSRDAGASAIREMLRSPGAGLTPVAVFDDDGRGHGLSLLGVPVVGAIEDIPDAIERYTIQQVFLAIPNPEAELVERALRTCDAAGVSMKLLPSVADIVDGRHHTLTIRRAREPQIEDLLGRSPVDIDLGAVGAALTGTRVLITGAGGSIGSEIARQVATFKPAQLMLLDHDETHLHDVAVGLPGATDQILVDVADREAIMDAFLRYRPEVVFHAAAHKHVPVLEEHPVEAARVNVLGTENVVDAAVAAGTERFVLISTDKAVRPASVMGASKQLAEQILLDRCPPGAAYCAVRFGNVLGSRGSVIPTFNRQIADGGPVTVTDARMTRFFMSVHEAVQLVLQASVLSSEGGEVYMLEMGHPVRILDLAERMIKLSGYEPGVDIEISIVGRRPGEKLHEELFDTDEEMHTTAHPSVCRLVPVPVCDVKGCVVELHDAVVRRDARRVRELLFPAPRAAAPLAATPPEAETETALPSGADPVPA